MWGPKIASKGSNKPSEIENNFGKGLSLLSESQMGLGPSRMRTVRSSIKTFSFFSSGQKSPFLASHL